MTPRGNKEGKKKPLLFCLEKALGLNEQETVLVVLLANSVLVSSFLKWYDSVVIIIILSSASQSWWNNFMLSKWWNLDNVKAFVNRVKVTESWPTVCESHGLYSPCILQARILEWVAAPFSRWSSQLRDRTQVSHIGGGFFTSWATRKPKNTRVGSLPFLQRIFPTQQSNWGLLHLRKIHYQLSYQGRPREHKRGRKFLI